MPSLASGSLALWKGENNPDDYGGVHNLAWAGTPTYTAGGPAGGTHEFGVFTDVNYLQGQAALLTAWSSQSAWTIEFYVKATSIANGPVVYYHEDDGTAFFQLLGDGSVKYQRLTARTMILQTAPGQVVAGNTYHIGVAFTGTNLHIYKALYSAGTLGAHSVIGTQVTSTPSTGTITSLVLGRYRTAGTYALNGNMDNVRLSTVARSTFPTADPAGSSWGVLNRRRRRG